MPGGNKNIKPEDGKRFSADYQPANPGRKPGLSWGKTFDKLVDDENGYIVADNVLEVDDDGKLTGNVFKKARVPMPRRETLALALVKKVMKGDVAAFREMADRQEGKATQRVEGTDKPILFQVAQAAGGSDAGNDAIE